MKGKKQISKGACQSIYGMWVSLFTLVELEVVIGVIAVLIAILFPALSVAKRHAKVAICLNNIRQISIAGIGYVSDNRGVFPVLNNYDGKESANKGRLWCGKKGAYYQYVRPPSKRPLNRYLGIMNDNIAETPVTDCPLWKVHDSSEVGDYDHKGTDYFANARCEYPSVLTPFTDLDSDKGVRLSSIYYPARMILVYESPAYSWITRTPAKYFHMEHVLGRPFYPISFVDGHARLIHLGAENEGITTDSSVANFLNFR